MGRLRLKQLSQYWFNSKKPTESKKKRPKNEKFSTTEKGRVAEHPKSPPVRCKSSTAPAKFCRSPSNNRKADIVFPVSPSRNRGRHARKAAVVSVGCSCRRSNRRQRGGAERNLQENGGPDGAVNDLTFDDGGGGAADSRSEGSSWHVIAKVNDRVVRKRVVLKNKNGAGKTREDGKSGEDLCRLSTSSEDTAGFEPWTCSWDKEYYSFTSDENLLPSLVYSPAPKSWSSFDSSFDICDGPRLSTIDESPLRKTLEKHCHGAEIHDPRRKTSTENSGSGKNGSAGTLCERDRSNAEASAGSSGDICRDVMDLETAVKACTENSLTEHFRAFCKLSEKDVRHPPLGKEKEKRKCGSRRDSMGEPLVENLGCRGKVGESVAVVKSSEDPYLDFTSSMLQMILEKQIYQWNDLRELLECFLCLNSREHHGLIIRAFTEIWEGIFAVESSRGAVFRGNDK